MPYKLIEDAKANQKKYYEANKEKILAIHGRWKLENKDRLNLRYTCKCGGTTSLSNKPHHEKTSKHCRFVNKKLDN